MPRIPVNHSERMNLRIKPEAKERLVRAAAIRNTDLTDFVLQIVLREADAVIAESEQIVLSERDSLRVLASLENPPLPNAKLQAAAKALP